MFLFCFYLMWANIRTQWGDSGEDIHLNLSLSIFFPFFTNKKRNDTTVSQSFILQSILDQMNSYIFIALSISKFLQTSPTEAAGEWAVNPLKCKARRLVAHFIAFELHALMLKWTVWPKSHKQKMFKTWGFFGGFFNGKLVFGLATNPNFPSEKKKKSF